MTTDAAVARFNWPEKGPAPGWVVLALMALFFVAGLPLLGSLVKYEGDERWYTDAALRMVETGDYLTPYYADGEPRFVKPVLFYWLLAASYHVLGFGILSSYLPVLLIACLLIYLTYHLALTLFGRADVAVVAAAVLASNRNLLAASLRSRPDLLLTLFLTLSLYGFARLVFALDGCRRAQAFAWIGAGLAVVTKGLLGVVGPVYASLFGLALCRGTPPPRRLFPVGVVGCGLLVAAFWFVAISWRHGPVAIESLFEDQIGANTVHSLTPILHNASKYGSIALRHFLPWTLLLIPLAIVGRTSIMGFLRKHRGACLYALGWVLLIFLVFLGGRVARNRYLLPAYPLLSCLLAGLLVVSSSSPRGLRVLRWTLFGLAAILGLGGGVALVITGLALDASLVLCGAAWIGIFGVLVAVACRRSALVTILCGALLALTMLSSVELFVAPVLTASPAHAVVARVAPLGESSMLGTMRVSNVHTGQIRLLSRGRIQVNELPPKASRDVLARYQFLLLSADALEQGLPKGYVVEACGHDYADQDPLEVLYAALRGDIRAALEAKKRDFYLAMRLPVRVQAAR